MDVANKAGIPYSKAARALNNSSAVAHETIERTRNLTREISCVPIQLAHSLKRDCSHKWEVTGQPFAVPFYSKIQGGFENLAHSLVIDGSFFVSARINPWGKQ
jgi:DNA-binding LacI/PurR family transcriptional regulator